MTSSSTTISHSALRPMVADLSSRMVKVLFASIPFKNVKVAMMSSSSLLTRGFTLLQRQIPQFFDCVDYPDVAELGIEVVRQQPFVFRCGHLLAYDFASID